MDEIAKIRPVIIMDEPHRFEGEKTQKALPNFNPSFMIRYGATFKHDEFQNLVYVLDSIDAFKNKLVKSITVDSVGHAGDEQYSLTYNDVQGRKQEDYKAKVKYQSPEYKAKLVDITKGDNLGEILEVGYLTDYVVEKITKTEIIFTNGNSLEKGQPQACGMLAEEMREVILQRTIQTHFEREEELFKKGIKALSLFFY